MNRNSHEAAHRWVFLAIFGDFLMALLASFGAFWVRFNTMQGIGHFTDLEVRQYFNYQVFGSTSLIAVLAWMGIYRSNMLLQSRKVTRRIVKGCMLWTAGFLLVALAFQMSPPISRIYMALNGLITLALLLVWRIYFDARLRHPSRMAVLQQRTILVGWSDDTAEIARQFNGSPEHALKVVGWVETGDAEAARPMNGLPCLGHVDNLAGIVASRPTDVVILTDLSGPRERAQEIANLCEREMVQFKIIPSCFRVFISGLQLENVGGTPILGVSQLPLDSSFNVLMKRCLDVLGAIVGLMLFTPVIALFSALVWLESRGPVFYFQRRTGANGKPFSIIKIRSMRLNAEANGGAQWCTANDPRRLAVGSFMRKWNIDELPQFWNVLKGEMSLVGPRPERPELIANFKHEIPHYNARHHAKPGMTGWAAIKGLRGDTDLKERIVADLWYLENWSLLLDIKIMLMTFSRNQNAY